MAHWHGGGFTGSTREEDALGKAYDSRLMKRLLRYAWPFKLYMAASLFLMIAVAACVLAIGETHTHLADKHAQQCIAVCRRFLLGRWG